jgi:hypothetical protein
MPYPITLYRLAWPYTTFPEGARPSGWAIHFRVDLLYLVVKLPSWGRRGGATLRPSPAYKPRLSGMGAEP